MMEYSPSFLIFMILYMLYLEDVTTKTTTTTPTTTSTTTLATTTLPPGVFDNCTVSGAFFNATISPNFDYLYSPDYDSGQYPSNTYCRWYISAPENYSVEAYFDNETYEIESNAYCRYDYVIFYDGNSTSDTMLNKFCGSNRPTSTYRSSGTQMLIVFSSDYVLEYEGFRIRIKAVDNTYPGCKADYMEYPVMYNRDASYIFNNYTYINNISSQNFGSADYPTNLEQFWLFTSSNTTHYKMVIEFTSMYIERAYDCIYDRLVLYDGPCIKDGVKHTVCGTWRKRWDLEGSEYLLHFHSDGYITRDGFQLVYYAEEKAVTAPPTTTTTTFGPPVEAVIEAVKEMLGNYSTENLPTRDLSAPITASVDFYLVGINGLDEVEQKMTSTGQFEVKWEDSSLSWDPTKRQGVVQVLLPQNDIWKPDIALMNGFSSITAMGAKFMFINVDYNGSCIWKPYQIMESVCKVDMTHYPYDRQTCVLKFGTWSTDDSEVVTELGSRGLQIHPNFQENAEWRLITTETRQEDNNHHKVVEFFLTLERNPQYITFYMTMPIIVLSYMNVFTFVIPSESGEKTGYSITIFLSFVVLLIINNDAMPENSDTISLYASFVLTMTILSAVALIVSVLQIRALTFTERKYPIPNCVKILMKRIKQIQSVLTCDRKKTKKDINDGGDDSGDSNRTDSSLGSNANDTSALVKKVSFKDDITKEEDENDRYSLPAKREPSGPTFKVERENSLFETNTFLRSATALSLAENTPKESKPERRISITKAVTFADEKTNDEEYKSANARKSKENTTNTDDTDVAKSELMVTKSKSADDQPLAVTSAVDDSKRSLLEADDQSTLKYDDTGKMLSSENVPTSIDLNHAPATDKINTPFKLIAVSPITEEKQNDVGHEQSQETKTTSSTENLANDPNGSVKDQHFQVAGLQAGANVSNECDVSTNPVEKNIKSESTKLSQIGSDENRNVSLGSSVSNSLSEGVESSVTLSVGNKSGSVEDDVIQNQPTSATDTKMNRPSSVAENRPLSVNRRFSYSESKVVLVDHGRAVFGGRDRPLSRYSERAVSALSQRSFVSQRPTSSFKREDSTALLFGAEEIDKQSTDEDMEENSIKSQDSIIGSSESSCSSESDEDDSVWSDLVSCMDAAFFIIYLFVTTLMTLAMFMTMVEAY